MFQLQHTAEILIQDKKQNKQKQTEKRKKKLYNWNTGEVFFQAWTRQMNHVNRGIVGSGNKTSSSARYTRP